MALTESILAQIRSAGYIVKVFKINGTVEIHAVHMAGRRESQIARCNDGDGPEETYRAACLLAKSIE